MYFPVLRNKRAEIAACTKADSNSHRRCCPVVKLDAPTDDVTAAKLVSSINRWVDVSTVMSGIAFSVDSDTASFLQTTLGELRPHARLLVAVKSGDLASAAGSIADLHEQFQMGGIVFVSPGDVRDDRLLESIRVLKRRLPLTVIVNFGDLGAVSAADATVYASGVFEKLITEEIDTLGVLGGSYPVDNSRMTENGVTVVPRVEAEVYRSLSRVFESLSFSDFGPISPSKLPEGPRPKLQTPAIRYAIPDAWMVHRGFRDKRGKASFTPQVAKLCAEIVDSSYFADGYFSWGDRRIKEIADGSPEIPGNGEGIRTIEISHHLAIAGYESARLFSGLGNPEVPQAV